MNISPGRVAKWIVGLYVPVMLCLIAYALIHLPGVVYATPERQSAFLQSYSPDATIKSFLRSPAIITGGTAVSSAAGPDAPIYMKLFEPKFVMSSNEEPTLTAALAANTVLAVRSNGGQVTAISGNDVKGYTFQYVDSASTGTVTMTPVHAANEDYWPLRTGELVATVKVTIDETWAKSR